MKTIIKKILPPAVLKWLYYFRNKKSNIPALNKINFGDFSGYNPFSYQFGYDRGGPVDRYYIENFLEKNSNHIKGRVLEIGDNEYTLRFGKSNILQSDILHITADNPKASFVGDLSNAPHLPADSFDCIILTQTLHFIYDFKAAIANCHRILKPGGSLLLTTPGISHIAYDQWGENWFWSFTDRSVKRFLSEQFTESNIEVSVFGNVFVASCFLYGVGLPEIPREQLDYTDTHYQLIIAAKATK